MNINITHFINLPEVEYYQRRIRKDQKKSKNDFQKTSHVI